MHFSILGEQEQGSAKHLNCKGTFGSQNYSITNTIPLIGC